MNQQVHQQHYQVNNKQQFFNLHMEGMAYLNVLKTVEHQGQSFLSLSVAFIEGSTDNLSKTYMVLKVPNALQAVTAVLNQYQSAINSQVQVFGNLKIAKLQCKPFVYGQNSKRAGELGVNLNATLISLNYLKVGNQVVHLVDKKVQAAPVQAVPTQTNQVNSVNRPAYYNLPSEGSELFEFPLKVTLAKNAPDFQDMYNALRSGGYYYSRNINAWMKSPVTLAGDDPNYDAKCQLLKNLGYSYFEKNGDWRFYVNQRSNKKKNNHYQSA